MKYNLHQAKIIFLIHTKEDLGSTIYMKMNFSIWTNSHEANLGMQQNSYDEASLSSEICMKADFGSRNWYEDDVGNRILD